MLVITILFVCSSGPWLFWLLFHDCVWLGSYFKGEWVPIRRISWKKNFSFNFSTANTAWKVSVFGVILVRIFPQSDWIRRDTQYSVRMRENTDQNNSEHGHFLRCVSLIRQLILKTSFKGIFWTLCRDISELSQTCKMERFAKIVNG